METYIEVTWFILLVIILSSHILVSSQCNKHISIKKICCVSIFYSIGTCIFYDDIWAVLFMDIVMGIVIYRHDFKSIIQVEIVRWFYTLFALIWTKGKIKHFILFVDKYNFSWLLFCFLLCIFSAIIKVFVVPRIHKYEFEIDVDLNINNQVFACRGFIDTGNTLSHRNIPVIFLSSTYKEAIETIPSVIIGYRTINARSCCEVYPCMIKIQDKWEDVYVAIGKQVHKPIDCLLNSRLFY